MDPTFDTAVLVGLALVTINAGVVGFVACAHVPSWIRTRRARRIEEAFHSGTFTVPTSWVREARRRPATGA